MPFSYMYVMSSAHTKLLLSFALPTPCPFPLHKQPSNSFYFLFILIYERENLAFVFSNLAYFA